MQNAIKFNREGGKIVLKTKFHPFENSFDATISQNWGFFTTEILDSGSGMTECDQIRLGKTFNITES